MKYRFRFSTRRMAHHEGTTMITRHGIRINGIGIAFAQVAGFAVIAITIMTGCGTNLAGSDSLASAPQVETPTFDTNVDTGMVEELVVEVSCTTPNAILYYTIDGSDPDDASPVYETGIFIEATTTVRVRAYADDLAPSDIAEETYSISGFALGMIALDPTEYSAIPTAMMPSMGELPDQVDLSPLFPDAGNQGQQGSCVGWAVAYALKTYQENAEHGWGTASHATQYSPAYVYNQIKVSDCNSGAYISHAFRLLEEQGCSTWATMPYNSSRCDESPSIEAREEAYDYRISFARRVSPQDITELRAQLAAGQPIVIGARIYTNFFYLRGDSIYDEIEGAWQGNHAMCIVGYDDATETFELINSWGRGWGEQGYARITYDVFKQITFEAYVSQDIVEQRYALDVTASGEGLVEIDPTGGEYYQGETVQLSAQPADGWGFVRWEGGAAGWSNPTTITMNSDKYVTAVFEPDVQTLSIQVSGGGTTDPAPGQHAYRLNESVVVTATAGDGCENWSFSGWSGDATGSSDDVVMVMDAPKAITAEFVAQNRSPVATEQTVGGDANVPFEITLAGTDDDGDALTYQIVGQPEHGTLDISELPVLRFIPEDGYVGRDLFTFRVSDGCTQSEEAEVDVFIGATIQYTVTVELVGSGYVDPFAGEWTYDAGEEVTLTASPLEGWRFSRWEGDVESEETAVAFTVDSDMDITAVFGVPLEIAVSPEDSGTVELDPPGGVYEENTWVTLTAEPDEAYGFLGWGGDLEGTDRIVSVKVEAPMSVTATFGDSPPTISILEQRTRVPWVVQFDMRIRNAAGRAVVDGVSRDDFRIYEDGDLLDYTETNQFVTPGTALPLKVMLVLDYTNSMKQAAAIDDMIAAARDFVMAESDAGDPVFTGTHSVGVVEFHDRTNEGTGFDEVVPLTRADAAGKGQIIGAIPCEDCREHGLTRVWDAVNLAIDSIKLSDSQSGEARAVVFLTDGADTTSVVTPEDLLATAQEHNVMLYPIGFGNVTDHEGKLQELASETSGMYSPAQNAASLEAVFADIARDLNGQWNLTYITQRNESAVQVVVEFEHDGEASFAWGFDAGLVAGDVHTGYVNVLERTYDSGSNATSFLLKAEYMPRNIPYFHFQFGDAGTTFALQSEGGITSDWAVTRLADSDYELAGADLQYGAFGNIGVVTVQGNVAKLKIKHVDDNAAYRDLFNQYGVTKKIEFEGTLWETY